MNEIRGTKVILREQQPEDAGFFAYWFNQPTVMFQCGFTEPTDEEHERKVIREFPYPKSVENLDLFTTDLDNPGILGAALLCGPLK